MKVAVQCHSPLLQKSLELFLEKYLSSLPKCDIVVRDEECLEDERCFYIANEEKADLKKPFSKAQLILALEKKYTRLKPQKITSKEDIVTREEDSEKLDFSILEKRIDSLTQEYQANIIRAVKAFYEK